MHLVPLCVLYRGYFDVFRVGVLLETHSIDFLDISLSTIGVDWLVASDARRSTLIHSRKVLTVDQSFACDSILVDYCSSGDERISENR